MGRVVTAESARRWGLSENGRLARARLQEAWLAKPESQEFVRNCARRQRESARGLARELLPPGYEALVLQAFAGCCAACGAEGRLELDHHRPLEAGYRLLHNAVPLCRSCNARKHARPPEAFYGAWRAAEIAVVLDELRGEIDSSRGVACSPS